MPGTFTPRLITGLLPNVTTVLYTCPAATTVVVKSITYMNNDGIAVTVNLYLNDGTTARHIIPTDMPMAIRYLMETDEVYSLEVGYTIEGDASTAGTVNYTISLIEET